MYTQDSRTQRFNLQTEDLSDSLSYQPQKDMKLQTNELFSSAIHPEQSHNMFEKKTDVGSEIGQFGLGQNFSQLQENKSDLKSVTEQLYKKTPHTRKWYIITGVLSVLLLASIGLNIYFGIKSNSHPLEKILGREIPINYFANCSDSVYEISVPNISGKRVMMNVTHWPDCFINRNFPKTGDSDNGIDTPQVNQFTPPPPPPNNTTNGTVPQKNQTLLGLETDNLIYIQEHKIAIVAWVYNVQ